MRHASTSTHPLSRHSGLFVLAATLALGACGEGDEEGSSSSSSSSGSKSCGEPGPRRCICTDGIDDGMQFCNPDGSLDQCLCVPKSTTMEGTDGTDGLDPIVGANVCADLKGIGGCNAESYKSEELPANILFLVDRSGSMLCNPPPLQKSEDCVASPSDENMPSKWDITTDALKTVMTNLQMDGSSAAIGIVFFSTDDYCGVHSEPTVGVNPLSGPQVSALHGALDAISPGGATPIVGGTILAYAHLHQEANDVPGCVEPCGAHGNRFVVLITDGADSCDMSMVSDADAMKCGSSCTDYLIDTEAPKALAANIRTFVIGAPGSEPAAGFLSDLAFEGGTSQSADCVHDRNAAVGNCHYDMTATTNFAEDLAAVLKEISGAALGCEFAVPESDGSLDPNLVNVQYTAGAGGDPICFKQDAVPSCDTANGWQFAKNPDGSNDLSKVVLCGSACDTVRNDAEAQVDVILGCDVLLE